MTSGEIPKSGYVKIAKDLLYSSNAIERIEKAQSVQEITRILKTERERRMNQESKIVDTDHILAAW